VRIYKRQVAVVEKKIKRRSQMKNEYKAKYKRIIELLKKNEKKHFLLPEEVQNFLDLKEEILEWLKQTCREEEVNQVILEKEREM
jgi:hypothetical protein